MDGSSTSVARCPRCGYDLSGEVSRWESACPLEGVCPECGLELAWRDVLNPSLRGPQWSIEHWTDGDGTGGLIARMLRTWRLAFAPGRLWSALAMHHEVRTWRLAKAATVGLLLTYALLTPAVVALRMGLEAWYNSAAGWRIVATRPTPVPSALWPVAGAVNRLWWPLLWDVAWVAAWAACMPVCLVVFRRTLRASRVRPVHVVRITLYGAISWPLLLAVHSLVMAGLAPRMEVLVGSPRNWWTATPATSMPWVGAATQAGGAVLIGLWLWVFWWMALSRYLRVRHAPATAVAMAVISLLAAVIVTGKGPYAWALVSQVLGIDLW